MQVRIPQFDVIVFGRARLKVTGEAHHVFPRYDIHIPHVDMIRREKVFKRIGGLTTAIGGV